MTEPTLYEFVKENALLIGLAFGSGVALLWPMFNRGASGVNNVTATEAVLMLNRGKPLILDVRDAAEFASGHIQGAKHIPVAELANRLKEIEKFKDKPVLVHCQRGMRSKTACTILKAQQFSQLNNLQGGLNAWAEAKLPLIKS
ncbi:MAG: sulfurtransferase [Proteobacteria bacterium ST_bin12]|nr:MAG: sulfurtransferase [Proteobacteria bacterium ST_bin12]